MHPVLVRNSVLHRIARFFKFPFLLVIPNFVNFEVLRIAANGTLVNEISLLLFTQLGLEFVPNVVLDGVERDFYRVLLLGFVHDQRAKC